MQSIMETVPQFAPPKSSDSKPVIICVDDEQMVLTSLKSQLKRHLGNEFIIETVDSAEEALEIFEDYLSRNMSVPLVISDQIMPGMKGDEFLKAIHDKNDATLKILLTGQASAEAIGNAVNYARLYRYIAKPWEQTDLNLTVSEAVRSYFQHQQLGIQNKLLKEYAENLEQKIAERTKEVIDQKALLEIKNKNITASISYASFIQQAMLPHDEELKKHLGDYFVFYQPRDIVSGDFYWCSMKENQLILIVADCTGHGVPGAFMSIISHNALDEIINHDKILKPSDILKALDQKIKQMLNQNLTHNNDGLDISVCVFDPSTKKLEFAGANNSLLLITKENIQEIPADKKSIGGFLNINSGPSEFTNHTMEIKEPTQLYMYSDGFSDQFGGSRNKKFLKKNLYKLLQENNQLDFESQKKALESTFISWKMDYDQIDDVLIFGFKLS